MGSLTQDHILHLPYYISKKESNFHLLLCYLKKLKEKILFKNSTKYSTPIAVINSGRLLIVKKEGKNWLKVVTGNSVGWIENEYLWGN